MSDCAQCDPPNFSDLEPFICTASGLSAALAMAIEGFDKLAMEDEHQIRALQHLASEAMYAAEKARELWYEIHAARRDSHPAA